MSFNLALTLYLLIHMHEGKVTVIESNEVNEELSIKCFLERRILLFVTVEYIGEHSKPNEL